MKGTYGGMDVFIECHVTTKMGYQIFQGMGPDCMQEQVVLGRSSAIN